MRATLAIARRELDAYFATPVGWLCLCGFVAITGLFFALMVSQYSYQSTQAAMSPYMAGELTLSEYLIAPFFGNVAVILLLLSPALSMRLFAEMVIPELGLPEQVVEGGETRIQRAADGHYWLRAEINGHPENFLVDTGATLTAVSTETADAAGLEPREGGLPVRMQTANGSVAAELTTIDELRFGNVTAHGLDAIIAPGLGSTNVIGMNLLSRLASVRLEGETMILVPNHPQPALEVR